MLSLYIILSQDLKLEDSKKKNTKNSDILQEDPSKTLHAVISVIFLRFFCVIPPRVSSIIFSEILPGILASVEKFFLGLLKKILLRFLTEFVL